MKTDYCVNIDKPVAAANEYGFIYGLLASGVFLHKWSMALSAQLALRYVMTVNGREKANQVPDELKKLGFELEASTLTRQPLRFKATKVLPRAFIRTYTLDTRLGRWCPRPVWDVVSQSIQQYAAFKAFADNFKQSTENNKLVRILKAERKREQILIERQYIEKDENRLVHWNERINKLRLNDDHLAHIYLDFDEFDFPYVYENKEDVLSVYDTLKTSIKLTKKDSVVVQKVNNAINMVNFEELTLGQHERDNLLKMFSQYRASTVKRA